MSHCLQPCGLKSPGSSVHGDSPDKNTEVGCHALLQEIVPTQELSLNLLCVLVLAARFFTTSHLGSPGGILLSHKKECIWLSSNEVGEPRAYTEYSKPPSIYESRTQDPGLIWKEEATYVRLWLPLVWVTGVIRVASLPQRTTERCAWRSKPDSAKMVGVVPQRTRDWKQPSGVPNNHFLQWQKGFSEAKSTPSMSVDYRACALSRVREDILDADKYSIIPHMHVT